MRTVIFTGGEFEISKLSQDTIQAADMIIAADSGANTAVKIGVIPHIVVGDLDSISRKTQKLLQNKNTAFFISPEKKDKTDTELAIQFAIERGATEITLLGGISGTRFDHIIANLLLPIDISIPITFINGNQISWIEREEKKVIIQGNVGDLLSLIPLSVEVSHITTSGLEYPLKNMSLFLGKARGVSNVLTRENATIYFKKGVLLLVHTVI